jgi:hypothetical protein
MACGVTSPTKRLPQSESSSAHRRSNESHQSLEVEARLDGAKLDAQTTRGGGRRPERLAERHALPGHSQ